MTDKLPIRINAIPIISLWMPWANWVSLGWKTIETRLHSRFKCLHDREIGIHASSKWDAEALRLASAFLTPFQIEQTDKFLRVGGAVIATARVKYTRWLTCRDSKDALIDCGSVERYGLILENITTIPVVPMRGKQGIWYVDRKELGL